MVEGTAARLQKNTKERGKDHVFAWRWGREVTELLKTNPQAQQGDEKKRETGWSSSKLCCWFCFRAFINHTWAIQEVGGFFKKKSVKAFLLGQSYCTRNEQAYKLITLPVRRLKKAECFTFMNFSSFLVDKRYLPACCL